MIEPAEQLITVFGGGGFIGRYVCEYLLKSGARIRVAQRNPRSAYFIQPLGQVGQFGFVQADLTNRDSVVRAIEGATAAINLVGVFDGDLKAVHVDGAGHVAEASRDVGASALVHISAIGADPNAESRYGRTKGQGEQTVGAAFPSATIIRPSLVFGPEDNLTNRFAAMAQLPILPVIAPKRRFQPVHVRNLARAIGMAALAPERHCSRTYEIGGPDIMTMRELVEASVKAAGCRPDIIELPDVAANLLSLFGFLPGAPLTRDQWLMLQRDNVPEQGAQGLAAFGIEPTPLGSVAAAWLGRFSGRRFHKRHVNLQTS